ncbi:MAG: FAD-dependent oxidoreductase [Bryobacteraceae bacterium]
MPGDFVIDLLAREILTLDGENRSLIPAYEQIIESGLSQKLAKEESRRDVLIIGAGIAGLITARALKGAGYNVTIAEANDNRIGGRIKTFRTADDGNVFKDPLQYAEAGAMRIPTTHPLVNKLIDVMGLRNRAQPFFNVDVCKGTPDVMGFRTWLRTNGIQVRRRDYNSGALKPDQRTAGFPLPDKYKGRTAQSLLDEALAPVNELIDITQPIEKQLEGWKQIIQKYDGYSMARLLREHFDSEVVVEYIGTIQNLTSRLFLSFLHSFIDTFYISSSSKYIELAGGNWQLPHAFLPELQENIIMDSRVIEIQWTDGQRLPSNSRALHLGKPGVYIRTINEPAIKRGIQRRNHIRVERELTADYLVVAIPFSALRFIDISPDFSYEKRRSIIELHYDSATKVLLEFSERFWEWDETEWRNHLGGTYKGHNSLGGASITDSPNRFIYYPSHRIPKTRGGVVLASYTWADDANRWDSIPAEDRLNFALKGLTDIYGTGIKRFFTGWGQTESWMEDYYAFGEAAVFSPGQLTTLHPHIRKPEGLVHFAGEHTSLKHAWVEGAIESGIRAAIEIHTRSASRPSAGRS